MRHNKHFEKGTVASSRGRKAVFSHQEANELKNCITDMAAIGFAPTISDIREIVRDYVLANDHGRAKKVFDYKGVKGCPGPNWVSNFIRKNKLSLKEATKLCTARHNATKNPFIVNHWFDILEKTVDDLGIRERLDLIWNADESGLPHEPKKCKVVSGKGQKTLQIVTGSDRDNTTVLAAVSASGVALPPLIIFQAKQVQSTWRPTTDPNHEYYPWLYANDSGWMKSDIFFKWFEEWEKQTRSFNEENELEPRLMIYDGHLSHVDYLTISLARNSKVTILKLPPHTTDLLQPLDVSVFKSLKEKWGDILFKRLRKTRCRLSKAEFATILSSDDVWKASLNEEGIKNGFRR